MITFIGELEYQLLNSNPQFHVGDSLQAARIGRSKPRITFQNPDYQALNQSGLSLDLLECTLLVASHSPQEKGLGNPANSPANRSHQSAPETFVANTVGTNHILFQPQNTRLIGPLGAVFQSVCGFVFCDAIRENKGKPIRQDP